MTPHAPLCHAPARHRPGRRLATLLLAVAGLVGTSAAPGLAEDGTGGQGAPFEQQVLFKAADEQGYACFRIPAIVKTNDGTLLAFAEGRVHDCGDAGDIDIVLKRSTDGGRTWGPLQVVDDGGGDTHGNPTPLVDRRTGRILLAETYNKGSATGCGTPCDRTEHLRYSDDDGATWSQPRDLTAAIRRPDWTSWYATGPVHGIQLTRGAHAGRLLFAVNAESFAGGRVTANHASLVYSDDGGASWHLGATDTFPVAADGTFRQKPQEMSPFERADGSVYVSARETNGTDLGNRTYAVSRDGGGSFAAPFRALPGLYTPTVQGSTLRLRSYAKDGYSRTLLAAPADPDRRRTMMIRSSWDEGRTWDAVDRGRVVTTDWSGYSDLVGITRDTVGLLYEGGPVDARDEIRLARFTEEWLGARRAPDPVTPDRAPGARPAYAIGGVSRTDGRYGGAAAFDGTDDYVRLPYRDPLALGTRDFTVSLWFRYSASSGEQPMLWMGGVGTRSPQISLRGLPGQGRMEADVEVAPDGPINANLPVTAVSTKGAYNDGRWHHAVLVRGGGRVTLRVDDETASAPDVAGSVSRNSPFGVHLGSKVDSRSWYTGSLDEVRVYDRSLTGAEPASLSGGEGGPREGLVLDLPLDHIRPSH